MKAEIEDKFSPLEKFTIKFIQEKFETLAQDCEHQFLDSKGFPNCAYHSSTIGYCQPELCPRLRSKQSERDDVNEVEHTEEKLIERLEQQ